MNYDLLNEYAKVLSKIKELTARADELKPQVIEHLSKEGVDKMQTERGTFSLIPTTRYDYPEDKIKAAQDAVKTLQAQLVESGEATVKESLTLRFQASKE